jgi:hypothetical protein
MNTAFLDAANLAWKIHHVESGFAHRSILSTYEPERKHVAEELLAFDAKYAKLFSTRLPTVSEVSAAGAAAAAENENEFVKTFKASCEFTSGYGVRYTANAINWSPSHPSQHRLFLAPPNPTTTLSPGRILPPATVTRAVDANVVHLEQEVPLNGAFRLYIFAGPPTPAVTSALASLAAHLASPGSFLSSFPHPSPPDQVHEQMTPHSPFFSILTVLAAPRSAFDIDAVLPPLLARYRGLVYADDVADVRVPGVAVGAAHAKLGIDASGAVVVVRPDGYVACVVRLEGAETGKALDLYFGALAGRELGGELGGEAARL